MLYVVSGFMRTGTSMMMRALEAGGLDAVYRQSRDTMKNRFADEHYDPNIGGLYELERKDYKKPNFPRDYDDKLIKALAMGVPNMNVMPNGIRVIFMRRDPEEIRQSYDAFFGRQLNALKKPLNFKQMIKTIEEKILNRKDVISFDRIWYREVIKDPFKHFEKLQETGWPIDSSKAAEVVDPECCRFKLEELEIGII